MSRWFNVKDSDSDSSSSSDYDSDTSSSSGSDSSADSSSSHSSRSSSSASSAGGKQWLKASSSEEDSDDDNTKRHQSNKERLLASLGDLADDFEASTDFEEWPEALENFRALVQLLDKHGAKFLTTPRVFLSALISFEPLVEEEKVAELKAQLEGKKKKDYTILVHEVNVQMEKYAKQLKAEKERGDEDDEEATSPTKGEEREETKKEDWSEEGVKNMLNEILGAGYKGKKARKLEHVMKQCHQLGFKHLQALTAALMAPIIIDEDPVQTHVSVKTWRAAFSAVKRFLKIVRDEKIVLSENETNIDHAKSNRLCLAGGLEGLLTLLCDECICGFRFVEGHDNQYKARLRDENSLLLLADSVLQFYVAKGQKKGIAKSSALMMDIVYARTRVVHGAMMEGADLSQLVYVTPNISETVEKLHELVLQHAGDPRTEARSTMCLVYQKALHDEFQTARDLLLLSRLTEQTPAMDDQFRMLYNRVLAQLGLCAFRIGLYQESSTFLAELCMYRPQEVRELLGQAIPRMQNYDQVVKFKARLVPYHTSIQVDLLEAVHLVVSMLIDVPLDARNPYDRERRQKNQFTKLVGRMTHQQILGPAENMKDIVYAASEALRAGNWKSCNDALVGLPVWRTLMNRDEVLSKLTDQVKIESLRTYLVSNMAMYSSLTVPHLANKFGLPENKIRSILSRMMLSGDVVGCWDDTDNCVQIHGEGPNKLQHLAMQLADKITGLAQYGDDLRTKMNLRAAGSKDRLNVRWGVPLELRGGRGRGGYHGGRGGGGGGRS